MSKKRTKLTILKDCDGIFLCYLTKSDKDSGRKTSEIVMELINALPEELAPNEATAIIRSAIDEVKKEGYAKRVAEEKVNRYGQSEPTIEED